MDLYKREFMYRGIVVYNEDPLLKGRVKIYVPGIYPIEFKNQWQKLPWAEPALALGGGNWSNERKIITTSSSIDQNYPAQYYTTNNLTSTQLNLETGWCTVPHAGKWATDGAQVWLFFEDGDINKPVYFASVQSDTGWFSEHPNQHVFHSDNVRVRIDEEPTRIQSTTHFNSYNDKCEHYETSAANHVREHMNTLIDIEIFNPNNDENQIKSAVNVMIHGNVNMKILGDWFVHHEGDKHQTHIGNHYVNHIGDTFIERTGNTNEHLISGDTKFYIDSGNLDFNRNGNENMVIAGNLNYKRTGDEIYMKDGNVETTITINNTKTVETDEKYTIKGNRDITINGTYNRTIDGDVTDKFNGIFNKEVGGDTAFKSAAVQWEVNSLNFK